MRCTTLTQAADSYNLSSCNVVRDAFYINVFEGLEIEAQEESERTFGEIARLNNKPKAISSVNFYEAENSEDDILFAVNCVLDDLKQVRQFTTKTWQRHFAKKMSLMNPTASTNTAIEFARVFLKFLTGQMS
ncbi:MAG: hypothetical protein Q9164_003546 [Protoblastenia rupestris]